MTEKDLQIQDLRAENEKLTEELEVYKQLEKKMHEKFRGHINTDTIVNSFIAFYDMQEVNEELAECLLITNENVKKYKEYQRLEEQGLLLKLPCSFGSTIYKIAKVRSTHWEEEKIIVDDEGEWKVYEKTFHPVLIYDILTDLGKTIFLTEQEAQSTLEKMKVGEVNG